MVKSDNFVRLLLIEPTLDDAESRLNDLRNGGVAVRPVRAESLEQLATLLREQPFDVAFANPAVTSMPVAAVVATIAAAGKAIPVIAVQEHLDATAYFAQLAAGAVGVAVTSQPGDTTRALLRAVEDLDARRKLRSAEIGLRESERRCDALLESSRDPIAYVHEGMHLRANMAYLEIFGFDSFEDVEGLSLLDLIAGDHADAFKSLLKSLGRGEAPPEQFQTRAMRGDGAEFDAVMEFQPATYEHERCQQVVIRLPGTGDSAELEKLRSHDLVTDLLNRQAMLSRLETLSNAVVKNGGGAAWWLIEADHFRTLLERVGLGNADLLLGDIAALIKQHLLEGEHAARIGEYTFALLSPMADAKLVRERAEAFRKAFEEHLFDVAGKSIGLRVSLAIVLIGEINANLPDILEEANRSLKVAQSGGGNRVELHDPGAHDRASLEAERRRSDAIKESLDKRRLVLLFQSVVSLQGEDGEVFDVLVRLDTEVGELGPGDFMPMAERFNLSASVDRWVIEHAIASLAERQAGGPITMFLRVSPQGIEDPSLIPYISQCLKTHRVSGDRLIFQMAESHVVTHLKTVRQFIKGLDQLHARFAIARFGSGLDSFQTLKNIDARFVKIDGALMQGFSTNSDNQQRVREICEQAHKLDKQTVAEWVEDTASMALLFGYGVSFVQGNFLQEPEKVMSYDVK
ncbi:MAG: EAL domain-containing protein [Lysobacterales bacterium]